MGKTVTTYLVDGDPQGTQYAFISNKICQMYVIPRSNLYNLNEQEKLHKPALYILIGEDETETPQAYIGETENFRERVKSHESSKGFWHKALIFISKDTDMTKADVQYLEHKAISIAQKTKTFSLQENKQIPKAPNLPEYQRDTMDEFFEDIRFLTSFIGYNIFDTPIAAKKRIFQIKQKMVDAKGFYDSSGLTVLKGSILSEDCTPSFTWKEKRAKLVEEYTTPGTKGLVLNSDLTFSSPSTAASFCLGQSANGWTSWINDKGQTLDYVYRDPLK